MVVLVVIPFLRVERSDSQLEAHFCRGSRAARSLALGGCRGRPETAPPASAFGGFGQGNPIGVKREGAPHHTHPHTPTHGVDIVSFSVKPSGFDSETCGSPVFYLTGDPYA